MTTHLFLMRSKKMQKLNSRNFLNKGKVKQNKVTCQNQRNSADRSLLLMLGFMR